ncbi:MAG: adenylate/guanylate cyclase domain-containing protein [Bryobacteraceae bacterium]
MPQRVLIVDDDPESLKSLVRPLADENPDWLITTADSCETAIGLVDQGAKGPEPIDLVITDLRMEADDSGMTVIREAQLRDPTIMTILFTAYESSLDRYAALDAGAFDVVEKNIRGRSAVQEINFKARAALRYRALTKRVGFLRRYFDPRLFETIERDPSLLQPSQRLVTICFWDIRGFSLLCEILKAHPPLIADFLKEYSDEAAKAIFQHGGMLDKFIGDGVMALFGVLNHKGDDGRADAEQAIRAAKSIRTRFKALEAKWMKKWKLYTPQRLRIGLGCGIHTGEVLVGNVGTEFRDQFTALGPHVNFAARVQARAESGQILLSQSTAGRVKVRRTPAGEISDIKNIPGTFALYSA